MKMKLNCDEENMLILNTVSFQKNVLSNLSQTTRTHDLLINYGCSNVPKLFGKELHLKKKYVCF